MRANNLPDECKKSNGTLAKLTVNNTSALLRRWKEGEIGFDPMRHKEPMICAFCREPLESYRYELYYVGWQPCCASCKVSGKGRLPPEVERFSVVSAD